MTAQQGTALVTGAAGFIGGHLSSTLLERGWSVIGVDSFTDFYDVTRKRAVFDELGQHSEFVGVEADLKRADPTPWLADADVVFHLAGQPGVRGSWAEGFGRYVEENVLATQHLLEAARDTPVRSFVFASSSSVYGDAAEYPCTERTLPQPLSPYGVTKLAAEHLCTVYGRTFGIPTVSLRYFSVYGPRQRPDMALSRIVDAAFGGKAFPMYGTGEQERDFTYVADVVEATIAAGTTDIQPGTVMNVSGGSRASLRRLIELVEEVTGTRVPIDPGPVTAGDVRITSGDNALAGSLLGWSPTVDLASGVEAQVTASTSGVAAMRPIG